MQTEAQNVVGRPAEGAERLARRNRPVGPHYKWVALTNTTLGVLMATIDSSIVLISLPVIFKGIHIDPLAPGETGYFLWMLLGYNPMSTLLPRNVQNALPVAKRTVLLGHNFFPNLISYPMSVGLHSVFYLSVVMCLVAALASLLRGKVQKKP